MSTDWNGLIAVLLLLALAFFLIWYRQRDSQSREREFEITISSHPLVIGNAKWDTLTASQQQVARLAARGLSNAEMAQQLGVKTNTVDAHLKKIYAALDVHSRAELSYRIRDQLD